MINFFRNYLFLVQPLFSRIVDRLSNCYAFRINRVSNGTLCGWTISKLRIDRSLMKKFLYKSYKKNRVSKKKREKKKKRKLFEKPTCHDRFKTAIGFTITILIYTVLKFNLLRQRCFETRSTIHLAANSTVYLHTSVQTPLIFLPDRKLPGS